MNERFVFRGILSLVKFWLLSIWSRARRLSHNASNLENWLLRRSDTLGPLSDVSEDLLPLESVKNPLVNFSPFEARQSDCLKAVLLRDGVLQALFREDPVKNLQLLIRLSPSFVGALFDARCLACRLVMAILSLVHQDPLLPGRKRAGRAAAVYEV